MIKVLISKTNDKYSSLNVSGHSNFDEIGKDIVCAGVSAVIVGGLNAFTIVDKSKISSKMSDGYVNIEVLDLRDDKIQLVMEVIIIQLRSIEENYKKYLKINENRR